MNVTIRAFLALLDEIHNREADADKRAWLSRLRGNIVKLSRLY